MSRRILMVLTVAAVVALMVVTAVPAAAQTGGGEVAFAQEKEKGKGKGKQKQMPDSGGFSGQQVALMGLGAGALLVGGGILVGVRRSTH